MSSDSEHELSLIHIYSTQQLSDMLFKKLGLPREGLKKIASGHYSTAFDVLEGLRAADTSGIVAAIIEHRELGKLKGTYVAVSYTHLDVYKRQAAERRVVDGADRELGAAAVDDARGTRRSAANRLRRQRVVVLSPRPLGEG